MSSSSRMGMVTARILIVPFALVVTTAMAATSRCLDWSSPQVEVLTGTASGMTGSPEVAYAMGLRDMGGGQAHTVIELSWQEAEIMKTETVLDTIADSSRPDAVSLYASPQGLHIRLRLCGTKTTDCAPISYTLRYAPSAHTFIGVDQMSRIALQGVCAPTYFGVTRSSHGGRRTLVQ